jgi:hypothetical protein
MMMIKKEKLTADKIYTLFFSHKTNVLPVKDVLIVLGSSDAKQVFRLLSELGRKGIISLNNNYDISIRNHYILLQKVLGFKREATATFLFTALKCYKTLIRGYLNSNEKDKEEVFIDIDYVWNFAYHTYDKRYDVGDKYNAINELIKRGYLIRNDYFKYKRYNLNIDKIVKEGILDYLVCVHGDYN